MLPQKLVLPALETLLAEYRNYKLLLIHPYSRFPSLLVATLAADPPAPLFFYEVPDTVESSLDEYLTGLVDALRSQAPGFGQQVEAALEKSPDQIQSLVAAMSHDLAGLADEDYLLILDEADRINGIRGIQTFFSQLAEALPDNCHLLLNGRTLPELSWIPLLAPGVTGVLKDDSVLGSGYYPPDTQATPTLELFALGPGQVLLNGRLVDTWDGTLPRLLLFFALDRPAVTRADICRAFWPELPVDQAVNVFHVTKRRMHKALGYDVLEFEQSRGGYFISPTVNLHYDAVDFVSELVAARGTAGEAAARHWQNAIDLYRGDYLAGNDDAWIVNRRQDFQAGYTEALSALAQIREAEGASTQALGLYRRASSNAPGRADLAETVKRLQKAVG